MTWSPDIVIYHDHCADGFGAAWACWRRWGDSIEYVAASYGQTPPDVAGKNVLIVDFSYKRPVLAEMAGRAASIIVLDHHKTAQEDLAPYQLHESGPGAFSFDDASGALEDIADLGAPRILAIFDMERSGARLAWDYCHPSDMLPALITLVEDRDLWRFNVPNSKAFALWLRAEPFTFPRFDQIAEDLEFVEDSQIIYGEAKAMLRFYDAKVVEIAAFARPRLIGGHAVPSVSCPPMFASDVAHHLLQTHPDAPFAATYYDTPPARMFSLRSEDHRQDVSEIAKTMGGGGHRNAAGFTENAE